MGGQQGKIGCVGVIAIVILIGLIANAFDGADEPASREEPPAVVEEPEPVEADIRIQAQGSRCLAVASEARIYIFMTLRNFSDQAGSIDVVPIRRYSDGTTNDSVIDTMTAEMGPLERKTFRTPFDYNALEHQLLECRLRVVGSDREVSIKAEQGF